VPNSSPVFENTTRRKINFLAPPLANRLCDATCVTFALWTICAHAVVAGGGNLFHLLAAFCIVLLAAGAFLGLLAGRNPEIFVSTEDIPNASEAGGAALDANGANRILKLRISGFILGIASAIGFAFTKNTLVFWWCAICFLMAAAVFILSSPRAVEPSPTMRKRDEWILWFIAFACMLLTALCHRPDIDDAFYVNVAVSVADFPSRALLCADSLLGVKGLPLLIPAHRIQTYELANGALSFLTGIPALYSFHLLSASFAALLAPLAYARLFRVLTPRTWLLAVVSAVVMLIAVGETHRSYGNFAFVRIWQGKAIFLTVFLPLIYAYALRFSARASLGRWILLAASQITAVGCTSSAVWAAPLAAGLALCSGVRLSRKGLRTLIVGALSSVYILVVGLLIKGEMTNVVMSGLYVRKVPPLLEYMFNEVLGTGQFQIFALASLVLAWACMRRGLAQRFAIIVPLGALLTVGNPYLSDFLLRNVTGPGQWRGMWAIPIPILLALLLCSPLQFDFEGWKGRAAQALFVLGLAFCSFILPKYSTLSPNNRTGALPVFRLQAPGLKVDEEAYLWAGKLNASVPQGSYVIAPLRVCPWIPTYHKHAYPLEVRDIYLWRRQVNLGKKEIEFRHWLSAYVSGYVRQPNAAAIFRRGLEHYGIRGVCLSNFSGSGEAREVLRSEGFKCTEKGPFFEIWVRSLSDRVFP